MLPEIPEWLANAVYTLTGISVGGYAISRRLKSDKNSDKVDDKTQLLIDSLSDQLQKERANGIHLGTVIDRLSSERNEAVKTLGELGGQLELMRGKLELMEKENLNLRNMVSEMRDEIMGMSQKIHTSS